MTRPSLTGAEEDVGRGGRGPGGAERRRLRAAALPLAVAVGRGLLRLLGRSLHVLEVKPEAVERLWRDGGPVIYAVWHGRMLMLPYLYGRRRSLHVLVSRSRDGELLSRLVGGFGLRVVRGSSSRGGATALRILARLLTRERGEVVVVPDGPRGPRWVAQAGPVLLARLSGAPVIPVGFGVSRGTRLASWDAFLVPHPFARAAVVFGDPLHVPEDADREAIEACRLTLEAALKRVTREADLVAGARGVPDL